MNPTAARVHSASRLFAVYVAVSLVPLVLFGLLLAASYRSEATRRGIAEARAMAELIANTSIQPLLDGTDLRAGLLADTVRDLRRTTRAAVADGSVVRLRLRDLDGRVVFSGDGGGAGGTAVDDEALDAAAGEVVARITRMNGDGGGGQLGERVVESYRPLQAGPAKTRVGVLEVYLPYEPIEKDIARGRATTYRDLSLGLVGLYVVLAALAFVTTRRLRRQALDNAYLAEHDPLTGLVNRRVFEQQLSDLEPNAHAAVAVFDLDRFKEVTDTIGHRGGDEMMQQLARRLAAGVGPHDLVARLGWDEFGIVLVGVGTESEAAAAFGSLRSLVFEPMEVAGLPLNAETSIGYALAPHDGHGQELVQRADIAMYVAKAAHAGVARYDVTADQYDSDRLALVGELRRALREDELLLHYQPMLHLPDDQVRTVEALVRWRHPRRGLLYPDAFVPAAEQTGLIDPLTDWVVATALLQVRDWDAAGTRFDVAVNVSARNLTSPGFADRMVAAVQSSGLHTERLLLEVTETALFTDVARATSELHRLQGAGIRISLDDFGQGQTSLSYLAQLPLTELKIDRAFVTDMTTRSQNAAIVRSVIDLAHNLGICVVAEGVEDEPTMRALRELGCDVAQGYVLARPMPGEQMTSWLQEHQLAFVR